MEPPITGILATKDYKTFTIVDSRGSILADGLHDVKKVRPCMPYDTVSYDPGSGQVKLIKSCYSPLRLTGTLELASKMRYGQSSLGVPLYLFRPDAVAYPPFVVGSTAKDTSKNVRALVAYESWTDPIPRGIALKIYGHCGNYDAECAAAADYALPPLKSVGDLKPLAMEERLGCTIECVPEGAFICNIDPAGCRDIDDVFGYMPGRRPGETVWWIIISAAALYVEAGGPIDTIARLRTASLYTPEGAVITPMLPPEISTDAGSLHADGRRRPGVAWKFTLTESGAGATNGPPLLRDEGLHLVWVCNKFTYTYENVLQAMPAHAVDAYETLARALRGNPADPHSWVEAAMISYNVRFARWLMEHGLKDAVLRAHRGPDVERYIAYGRLGGPSLARYAVESARYVGIDATDTVHVGLDAPLYTHASSPLRRYVDLHNQRLYLHYSGFALLHEKDDATLNLPYVNWRTKALKSYAQALHFMDCLSSTGSKILRGTVIEVSVEKRKARVYVESWGLLVWWRNIPVELASDRIIGCVFDLRYYVNVGAAGWKSRFVLEEAEPADK